MYVPFVYRRFLELKSYVFQKLVAVRFIVSQYYANKIINYSHKLIEPQNADQLAKLVVKSLHPITLRKFPRGGQKVIIFAGKAVFNQEILNIFSKQEIYVPVQYSRRVNRSLGHQLFGEDVNHFNYKKFEDLPEIKQRALGFFEKYLRALDNHYPFACYLCSNFGVFDEQPMARALVNLGKPFFVFHKECVFSPSLGLALQKQFAGRSKFQGSKILVYNETTKDLICSTGLARPDQIDILGMARLDELHHFRCGFLDYIPKQPSVTLFFPAEDASLPSLIGEASSFRWKKLCAETCSVLWALATQNPSVKVFVKPKARDEDFAFNLFYSFGAWPRNLIVSSELSAASQLKQSNAIVAFNSTVVLEAIAAGKKCFVPGFEEASYEKNKRFLIDFGKAVTTAKSKDDLLNGLMAHLRSGIFLNKTLTTHQVEVLNYWASNSDGLAGKRLLAWLEKNLATPGDVL